VPAGTIFIRTAQPPGTLAAFILEPQSEDGLSTWGFFDDGFREGAEDPVVRLPGAVPVTTGRGRPLPEERHFTNPSTYEEVYGSDSGGGRRRRGQGRSALNFSGSPVSGLIWLDDGEHFLQVKEGRLLKVHALSGRSQPFFDSEKLAKGLSALP